MDSLQQHTIPPAYHLIAVHFLLKTVQVGISSCPGNIHDEPWRDTDAAAASLLQQCGQKGCTSCPKEDTCCKGFFFFFSFRGPCFPHLRLPKWLQEC
eukprot:SAG11_NODE_4210_length_2012_cov_2.055410_3_plen_97_part_00